VKKSRQARIRVAERDGAKRVYADLEGKDVSRVYILPRRVRMGPAGEVLMAGIGGVGTQREHRRKGLARRVFTRVMQEIGRDGYSCSGLFTGTAIVAHRLYRQFGYVDIAVQRNPRKLLNPKAVVLRGIAELAKGEEFADWSSLLAVNLKGCPPVFLRLERGTAKALRRSPRWVNLSLSSTPLTFGLLMWGRLPLTYAAAAGLLEWEGEPETWQRLARALARKRPGIWEG